MTIYKKVYLKLDPIIKADPKISYEELKKKHPGIKIKYWSFNDRKNKLNASLKPSKKVQTEVPKVKPAAPVKKVTPMMIIKAVKKLRPSSPRKGEYIKLGKILAENPNAIHSHLLKAKKITMCDANFYQFRKAFCEELKLPLTSTLQKRPVILGPTDSSLYANVRKKKASLYTVLYERKADGIDDNAKELLIDFINTLKREKMFSNQNVEIVELVSPNKTIEVRSFAR